MKELRETIAYDEYHAQRKETDNLIKRHRREVHKNPEYMRIVEQIIKLRTLIILAKRQQRLMSRELETNEIKQAKISLKTSWDNFVRINQEERDKVYATKALKGEVKKE